jgi:TPR repeat protein
MHTHTVTDYYKFRLAELAAINNVTNAQFNLGLMYYTGIGTAKSMTEAEKWF